MLPLNCFVPDGKLSTQYWLKNCLEINSILCIVTDIWVLAKYQYCNLWQVFFIKTLIQYGAKLANLWPQKKFCDKIYSIWWHIFGKILIIMSRFYVNTHFHCSICCYSTNWQNCWYQNNISYSKEQYGF